MNRIRLGVVGCGVIGQYHLRHAAAVPRIELQAVADLRREAAEAAATQFNVPRFYDDGRRLIDDPNIDAVVLAMPTALRFDLAVAALERGKHVLLEKPAAMNVAQIKQLMAICGDRVVASCSSRNRSLASAQAAQACVASGKLGEIRTIHCRVIRPAGPRPQTPPPAWRLKKSLNGGGIFVNWGHYDLDYLLGICGWRPRPRLVMAQTWGIAPHLADRAAEGSDAETHIAAIIRCDDGETIHYETGEFTSSMRLESWQIIASHGSLWLRMNPAQPNQVILDTADAEQGVHRRVIWEGDENHDTIHAGPVTDFADAILDKRPPRTGLAQSLVLQAITDAAYLSAGQGCAVEIDAAYDLHCCPSNQPTAV